MPAASAKKTAISAPSVRPVTVVLAVVSLRPLTYTRPAGSLVDAETTTVPAVPAVVVMP